MTIQLSYQLAAYRKYPHNQRLHKRLEVFSFLSFFSTALKSGREQRAENQKRPNYRYVSSVYFGVCLITLIYICCFISIGVTEVDILGPYIGGLFVSVSKSIERFAKFASLSWHMWNYRYVFITLSLQKAHAAVAL